MCVALLHFVLGVLLLLIETRDQIYVTLLHFLFFSVLLICIRSVKMKSNTSKSCFVNNAVTSFGFVQNKEAQKQPSEVNLKKYIPKNFAIFTGKYFVLKSYFNKIAGFVKRRLQHRCFPVNIRKFLRTPTWKNNCKRLLLKVLYKTFYTNITVPEYVCELSFYKLYVQNKVKVPAQTGYIFLRTLISKKLFFVRHVGTYTDLSSLAFFTSTCSCYFTRMIQKLKLCLLVVLIWAQQNGCIYESHSSQLLKTNLTD